MSVRIQVQFRNRLRGRLFRATAVAFALAGLLATHSGCRSFLDRSPFARNLNPPKLDDTKPVLADEVLDRIDGNSRKVGSLIANLYIQADIEKSHYGVDGRMWMRRDRDFRLMVEENFVGQIADLGSNSEGFWFWTKTFGPGQPKQYLACSYDEAGSTPLDMVFQPDWIVEAIGLRSLSPDDRKSIEVEEGRGADEGNFILRQRRANSNGDVFYKETIVSQRTGLIKQHKLLGGPDGKTPLALAQIEEYQFLPVGADSAVSQASVDGDDNANPASSPETVALPKKFRLVWTREKIALNIQVTKTRVNPEIESTQFVEPAFLRSYNRIDLGELANARRPRSNSNDESESEPASNTPTRPRERQSAARRNGVIAASNEVRQDEDRTSGSNAGSGFGRPFKKARSLMDELIGAPYPRGPQ